MKQEQISKDIRQLITDSDTLIAPLGAGWKFNEIAGSETRQGGVSIPVSQCRRIDIELTWEGDYRMTLKDQCNWRPLCIPLTCCSEDVVNNILDLLEVL
jgi:hypothetical protein